MAGHNICMVATFLHPFNLCLKLLKPFSNGHKLKLVLQQLQTTLLLVLAFKNILKPCSTSSKDCAFYASSCYPLLFHCFHVLHSETWLLAWIITISKTLPRSLTKNMIIPLPIVTSKFSIFPSKTFGLQNP